MSYKIISGSKKAVLARILVLVSLLPMVLPCFVGSASEYTLRLGTPLGKHINVRSEPSESASVMTTVSTGDMVTVLSTTNGDSGKTWYFVRSEWGYEGYVRGDLLSEETKVFNASTVSDFSSFLSTLSGFPESFYPGLLYLHTLYPSWRFEAQPTGVSFADAVAGESALGRSTVEASSLSSWKSTAPGAYNENTGKWIGMDGSNWHQASEGIIAYYMDPRNFFSPSGIFQFLSLSFDGSDRDTVITALRGMLSGTFMEGERTYANNGETIDYASVLYEAGLSSGVSPYGLASMALVEQGGSGSRMVDGDVEGYLNLYNFFNIGAYTTSSMGALERGLWYAGGGSSGSTSFSRPWNTRSASIRGGAEFFYDQYVSIGQDTLYTKRFNVAPSDPSKRYIGQYMSATYGAAIEGATNAGGYSAQMRALPLVFRIPVYSDMPDTVFMPLVSGSPNSVLSALSVGGYDLTPTFSPSVTDYTLVVPNSVSSIPVLVSTVDASSRVEINNIPGSSAEISLSSGDNIVAVKVTAGNKTQRTYTVTVTKRGGLYSDDYAMSPDGMISGVIPGTIVSAFLNAFSFGEDAAVTVCSNADNSSREKETPVCSGDFLKVTYVDGAQVNYDIVIYGDINGDGTITNADRVKIRNHILGINVLSGLVLRSADVNHDGSVNNADRVLIRNYILGSGTIGQ